MAEKKTTSSTPVDSVKHKDRRKNIPTEEMRGFVTDDEKNPRTIRYSRDPSLDPQLVWTGKDEPESQDLEVPAVPIYIQEKIHPQAIVGEVRTQASQAQAAEQIPLFADFNGICFEDLIEFYQHEQNWTNRMILGDSLLVMNSLSEKEGLKGKVQMIYIDPPYGIKFGSNWQVSTRKRDVKDGKIEDVTRQPEQVKAFRDTWQLGIHSYLAYLRDRLVVARELLTETGSIFVQIGDENVHLVRNLLDEVFGNENFVSQIAVTKSAGGLESSSRMGARLDYLIWYAKTYDQLKYRPLYEQRLEPLASGFSHVEDSLGNRRPLSKEEKRDLSLNTGVRLFRPDSLTKPGPGSKYTIKYRGKTFDSGNRWWGSPKDTIEKLISIGRVEIFGNSLRFIRYHDDFAFKPLSNLWDGLGGAVDPIYVVQTTTEIVKRCLLLVTDPGDLVIDPTCGSGTTAYVAEQWGRRWITIDTSRVALAIARTRLMSAKYPFYLLADSPEGIQKEGEITGQLLPMPQSKTENDIKKGFVYKRVPHVTLKAIANNPEIDTIHAKYQQQLEPIRTELNRFLKKSWEEWQIPREPQDKWSEEAKNLLREWWELRLSRQKKIDEAIARHSDTELLYDQPYEDNKRIRVTGPFTVESLSPHRVLSTDEERPTSETAAKNDPKADQFINMIIENLKKAGVQNTYKNERLKFDYLEPYAGQHLHVAGEYTEGEKTKRVAIHIGPEHGTVVADDIKNAAKEAVQGIGFDLLLICGFAFGPHVSEEAKRYGKLPVLVTRMNPDLTMGDELLKKTGAGNLFMVFGEPDLEVKKQADDKLTVKVKGVDVYDPTTGQIRSSSTDDIACWFIDTNYNEESFFVRHAYFTGADDPYKKLKRALKADINESVWETLYSTTSYPFEPPKTGKIAVKVINHYGDEVLKVYAIACEIPKRV